MAYKATVPVNWCPNCKTVLSNEDAAGGVCERCGTKVVQKKKSQWMLRMSDYSEDLLKGLDDTNFAEKVKLGQINWIGENRQVPKSTSKWMVTMIRSQYLQHGVIRCSVPLTVS